MVHTGRVESAAVTRAFLHWVIVRLLASFSTTFSVVWLNRPMTSPVRPAALYASRTVK